ncbi:MAG TPA: hypothetical protein DIW43_07920 [Spongiibacteraceae bacterium]|nr:hypothetical protein [Spongiibacteraceae bacterium]HCS27366.1 hypothetical protein [Spongiibacteraceae bacterium]|tara:strand:- start:1401 stop:2465 length:1065 start_codon:yes stop_codon:yes gene_type:complete
MAAVRWSILMALVALVGCDAQSDIPCEAVNDRVPICGLQAPEDIEVSPDQRFLILSQFGGITGDSAGSLALFNPVDDSHSILYPPEQPLSFKEKWGNDDCPGEPGAAISPHGIHLSQRSDGRWQLLVVNHGGRESVEFFEWQAEPYRLNWRGCVVTPEGSFLNDVVATPDGGFLVTQMFPKDSILDMLRSFGGAEKGHVWRWRPGKAVDIQPGSLGAFPNGIQISPDGNTLFLNLYANHVVRKIDRESGEHLGEADVVQPDNSNWLPDGRLLVASHPKDTFIPELCSDVHSGACEARFLLVAINPETMQAQTVFEQKGAPMGAGTAAVEWGNHWYIGSYAGNRLLKVPVPRKEN